MPENNSEKSTFIQLDQFLKWQGIVATGGEAKLKIQGGDVKVNGQPETRRKRKLFSGDEVTIAEVSYEVKLT